MVTDVYVVIDLDRTLFDTSKFSDATIEILRKKGVDPQKVEDIQKAELQERGMAFDLIAEIRKHGEDISLDDFTGDLEQYICPGVRELFQVLNERNVPHTVLTYGGQAAQSLKLTILERTLGYTVHSLITDEKNKSAWIHHHSRVEHSEVTGEVQIVLPAELTSGYGVVKTRQVVILDDKPANFDTDSPYIRGILIDNDQSGPQQGATSIWDLTLERILEGSA